MIPSDSVVMAYSDEEWDMVAEGKTAVLCEFECR